MYNLKNDIITLRALEPEDLDFLFSTENDNTFWEVSSTQTPFSKHVLKKYLTNAHQDIYEAKQLRLVITDTKTNQNIGFIDLFDFNPQHQRTGIGILILQEYQNKGFASTTLKMLIKYAFTQLNLHQIYANIPFDNTHSILLFKKLNFKKIGTQKDWILSNGYFKDVHLYQIINSK
ncbi:MAG: GNAT family N-acetyltransferase [Flavobacteriaceae bacterium]|nr:GNAT family N-acetyltransferase [Flavobacteriaceae bacterium]